MKVYATKEKLHELASLLLPEGSLSVALTAMDVRKITD